MNSKIKVAVIGTGHLGTIHCRLWKNVENAELVGIYDIDREKTQKLAEELNCIAYDNLDDALNSVEAITIATPTSTHFEIAKQALSQKIHCFIEKPIANNYQEAQILTELSEKNNLILQVGHVERFNPALLALNKKELNPMFIETHRLSQFKPRATDVSVVHDLMIHDIDIVLWLIQSPIESIDATGVDVLTNTTDIANARIKFQNGAVVNLTSSRISAKAMRKMRIFQKNAYISIDFAKQDVEIFKIVDNQNFEYSEASTNYINYSNLLGTIEAGEKKVNIVYEKPKVPELNAIQEEQKAFINSITNSIPPAVNPKEASEALKVADLISEEIENHKKKIFNINKF